MSEVQLKDKDGDLSLLKIYSQSPTALSPINRGAHLIEQLEALAGEPRLQKEIISSGESSALRSYSAGFAHLIIPNLILDIKKDFPNEPFIAADIGGSYGSAGLELERAGCDRCFIIDPYDHRSGANSVLPVDRYIIRKAENMHGIPDESFQFIISFNALTYSDDLGKALSEIFRVLRPGGVALVDIEWWTQGKDFEALNSLTLPADIEMHLLTLDRKKNEIITTPLRGALEIASKASSKVRGDDALMIGMFLGRGFIIDKAPNS